MAMNPVSCFWVVKDGDVWKRTDTGASMPYPGAFGVGAMWDASPDYVRMDRSIGWVDRGDGHYPVVMTPGGEWCVDGPSFDKDGAHPCPWTRTGDPTNPPTFTVHPSIHFVGRFHGWLKNGVLTEC